MPKTLTAEPDTSQQDETKRQRKKQAKQEAKIMLKVEQAKKGLKKAQKKLTRAQANLDKSQAQLQKLEEQLQQIHASEEPQAQASQTQEVIDEVYQEPLLVAASSTPPQADTEAIEAFHTASITDDDTVSDHETDLMQETDQPAEQVINAQAEVDAASYPSDEQTTPSPEAIAETDTTSPANTAANGNSTLSPDEVQSLVEHGNEEPELSNNPNASSAEKPEAEAQESNQGE